MEKRKKAQLTLLACGSLFVVWRVYSLINRNSPAPATADTTIGEVVEAAPIVQTPASGDADVAVLWEAQRAVEKQPWGRDPFDPSPFQKIDMKKPVTVDATAPKPPSAPTLAFNGVSRAGQRWLAAVNGNILHVGDFVQEKFKVVGIANSSITLASDGWEYRYELGSKDPVVRPCDQSTAPDRLKETEKP